ncbi:MAG: hypothetical protein LBB42_03340 [Coriobacteriales bacterium]|jgi:hypothetical protein|nr:hypothetical protein [Coriobacteriales bacterium]
MDNSVSKRFLVDVPDAPLFYPCCGNDTLLPLSLFMNDVSDYYFVDIARLPNLPSLEINRGKSSDGLDACVASECTHYDFPARTISKSSVCGAGKLELPEISDSRYCKWRTEQAASWSLTGKKAFITQEWQHLSSSRILTINQYQYDGLAVLFSLERIGVFFLRGDSLGFGGSGQRWLQQCLLDFILSKLVNGGLILWDGGYEADDKGNPACKLLSPEHFRYLKRNFRFLGIIKNDRRSTRGPINAWQVSIL